MSSVWLYEDRRGIYQFSFGNAEDGGEGDGVGENLNMPLPAGTDDAAYVEALERLLSAIADRPGSLIVVSLGFDTYRDDPICDFALTTPAYHEIGRQVASLGRRLVVLQEGGYHLPTLGANAASWLRGADGRAGVSGP